MRLTQRTVASIGPVDRLKVFFDSDLKGFGLRCAPPSSKNPDGARTWILEYRPNGGGRGTAKRRLTLGTLADLKPDAARKKAELARAAVVGGHDPVADKAEKRAEATLADAWAEYEKAQTRRWKASTLAMIRGRWANHIAPTLGKSKVSAIGPRDVQRLHARISEESPVAANRVLANLSAFFGWWMRMNPGALAANPVAGVERNPEEARRNYLTAEQVRSLFKALNTALNEGVPWAERTKWKKHTPQGDNRRSFVSAPAARAIRLLAYTGCRLREVLHLKWESVDFVGRRLVLTDTKTGYRMIPLGEVSLALLQEAWDALPTDPDAAGFPAPSHYVFAETPGGPARRDLQRPWATVLRAAGLPANTRIHDLRHSAASLLINSGAGLELVAGVLGHKSTQTARRYAHLMDSTVRAAADLIARQIDTVKLPAPAQAQG